jgi:hypothetical protein
VFQFVSTVFQFVSTVFQFVSIGNPKPIGTRYQLSKTQSQ